MGKRIVSQARGHGSLVYRVRKQGYVYRIGYHSLTNLNENAEKKARIIKILHSPAHSAPLLKLQTQDKNKSIIFYNLAFKGAFEGQEISIGVVEKDIKEGDIIKLKDAKIGTQVYNIEAIPGDGGKFVRASGISAQVVRKDKNKVLLLMPSKKVIKFNDKCRATAGVIASAGRLNKPLVKAGKRFHAMKARGKRWHFTSKVKVNAVDHPFGGGRGKRIKSKIAKRNAPPGAKVGHIRPRQTGRRK